MRPSEISPIPLEGEHIKIWCEAKVKLRVPLCCGHTSLQGPEWRWLVGYERLMLGTLAVSSLSSKNQLRLSFDILKGKKMELSHQPLRIFLTLKFKGL